MKNTLVSLIALTVAALPLLAQNPASPVVKEVTPDEAQQMLAERKDVVVLDVRTADEFKAGHIPGAKNLDFLGNDFAKQLAALDKSKTYLVHCASGSRSTRALPAFDEQKFSSVLHLKEGFKGWEKAGKPVEK